MKSIRIILLFIAVCFISALNAYSAEFLVGTPSELNTAITTSVTRDTITVTNDIFMDVSMATITGKNISIIGDNSGNSVTLFGNNNTGLVNTSTVNINNICFSSFTGAAAIHNVNRSMIVSTGPDANVSFMFNNSTRTAGGGGAIYNVSSAGQSNLSGTIILASATFYANNALNGGKGGAIFGWSGSNIILGTATFISNTATEGGAIFLFGDGALGYKSTLTCDNGYFELNRSTNHGGAIHNTEGGVLILSSATFFRNSAGTHGGAIASGYSWANAYFGNVTFTSNTANANGGAIYHYGNSGGIAITSTGTWASLLFQFNRANNGGAVYNNLQANPVNLIFSSSTYIQNTATTNGGAIFNASYLTFGNAWFFSNSAASGGAIYNASVLTSTLTYSMFSLNRAANGGAVFMNSGGIVFDVATFTGNIATSSGGALYLRTASTVTFTYNAIFTNNISSGSGGAIYLEGTGNVYFAGSNIVAVGNIAGTNGGFIYSTGEKNVDLTFSNITYANNTAANGGLLYGIGGTTFRFNGTDTNINNSTASVSGGAIYLGAGSGVNSLGTLLNAQSNQAATGGFLYVTGGTAAFAGANISNNTASVSGGAIYAQNNSKISFSGGTTTFQSNTSLTSDGGAVYLIGSSISISNAYTEFINNSAAGNGGAIYAEQSIMSFSGSIMFSSNSVNAYGYGGAIFANQSTMNFSATNGNIEFNSNKATGNFSSGGAIRAEQAIMNFIVSTGNIVFSGNSVGYSGFGGAISALQSTMSFSATNGSILFSSNSAGAGERGGAIYANKSSMSFITVNGNIEFNSNRVETYSGGAIAVDGSTMSFNVTNGNILFSSNSTSANGGAIGIWSGNNSIIDFIVSSGNIIFTSNKAGSYGGAIVSWADDSIISFNVSSGNIIFSSNTGSAGGALYLLGSTMSFNATNGSIIFSSNSANSYSFVGSGGAIYAQNNSNISFSGGSTTFQNNKAVIDGGAIYLIGSSMSFSNVYSEFINNSAEGKGGAIYLSSSAIIIDSTYGQVMFAGNRAALGSDIYANNSQINFNALNLITISSGIYIGSNNNAINKTGSGELYLSGMNFIQGELNQTAGITTINQSTFTFFSGEWNVTDSEGIRITNSNVTVESTVNSLFRDNSKSNGGAIFLENATAEFVQTVDFISNTAGDSGGAMYIGSGATVAANNITFTGNTAGQKGGAVYMEGTAGNNAVLNITQNTDTLISGNMADGESNVFYLEQYSQLNLNIADDITMTIADAIASIGNSNNIITKTGKGILELDSNINEIDGILNIFDGTVRTGYATGIGDIYFTSGTLNIMDDVTMTNKIYALDSNSIIDLDIISSVTVTINGLIGKDNTGIFEKNGLGKIIISGSGSNIGKTDVNSGEMVILSNDFGSERLTVKEHAILSGTGKIIGNVTNNGFVRAGYVSPSDTSFGTLTINGNYIESGNLGIRLNEGAIGSEIVPTNDKLIVTGNATINTGSLIDLDMTHGFEIYKKYTILESNGLSGIYSGLKALYPSIDIRISKDANNVYLKIAGIDTDYMEIPGLDHNNTEVAKIIDETTWSGDSNKINDISKIVGTMDPLDNAGRRRVLEETAGSIYANALLASGQQMRQAYHRILDRRESGYEGYNVWAGIYGSQRKVEQDSNSGDFKARNGYLILGLEKYSDNSNFMMGYYASIGQHDTHQWDDIVDINDYRGGLYLGKFIDKWTIRAELSGGYQQYQGKRQQLLLQSRTESEYDGWNINANVEAFYKILESNIANISPFAGLDGSFIKTSGFREKGFDNAAAVLTVKDNQFEILNAAVGLRAEKEVGILRWYGELGARYNLRGSKGTFTASLNNLNNEMKIFGAGNSLLSGKAELGFSADIWKGLEVFAMGSYEKAERFHQVVGETGIGYRFGQTSKDKEQSSNKDNDKAKRQEMLKQEEEQNRIAEEREAAERAAKKAEEERTRQTAIAALKKQIETTRVHFDFDKSNLRPDARRATEEIAQALKELKELDDTIQVTIEGHTDEIGTHKYNEGLSQRRANAVHKKLVELGVEAEMLDKQWFGKTRPTATNKTKEGRAQNRRAEIILK
ncbi:MAG: OmpA family protein [Endomicrobia bacterium]|nr:OmpA family protein [Endomicrobiia bacterium]MCL2506705.1 OmpA family protein [Endomicrobiia bacterium]